MNLPDDWDEEYGDEEFDELAIQVLFPRRAKVFRARKNHFLELRDDEFFDRFRLSKPTVQYIVDKIRDKIACITNW